MVPLIVMSLRAASSFAMVSWCLVNLVLSSTEMWGDRSRLLAGYICLNNFLLLHSSFFSDYLFTHGVLFSYSLHLTRWCVCFLKILSCCQSAGHWKLFKENKRRDVREGVWRVSAVGLCDWRVLGRRRRQGLRTVSAPTQLCLHLAGQCALLPLESQSVIKSLIGKQYVSEGN